MIKIHKLTIQASKKSKGMTIGATHSHLSTGKLISGNWAAILVCAFIAEVMLTRKARAEIKPNKGNNQTKWPYSNRSWPVSVIFSIIHPYPANKAI